MTQQYTPVTWQDETTSQQGTLINAERLNQMQTAHHFADGFEEVDAVPTANPGVAYHKIVYCTADSTFYRWDGTQWTKDIDDETKALLQQEIARATEAEGELAQDLADETTARETADTAMQADITAMQSGKLDKKTTGPLQYQIYGVRGSNQIMFDTWGRGHTTVPTYGIEEDLLAKMPTYGLTDDTVVNYGWATGQIGAEATARAEADTLLGNRITAEETRATQAEQANAQAIANTYTKAETDTLLAAKADQATTYTKTETDTLLASKANDSAVVHKAGDEDITGVKTHTYTAIGTNPARADLGRIRIKASNVDITNNAHGIEAPSIQWWDNANHICGVINSEYEVDGSSQIIIGPRRANGNMSWFIMNPDYMAVPTPGTGAPNNAVATLATLDGYLPMVRTTGAQTIGGDKTFTGTLVSAFIRTRGADGYRRINIDRTDDELGVTPQSSVLYPLISWNDKNNNLMSAIYVSHLPDGTTSISVQTRNSDGTIKYVTIAKGDVIA